VAFIETGATMLRAAKVLMFIFMMPVFPGLLVWVALVLAYDAFAAVLPLPHHPVVGLALLAGQIVGYIFGYEKFLSP